jgi:hypothetical protein
VTRALPTNHAGIVTADVILASVEGTEIFLAGGRPLPREMTTKQVAAAAHVTVKAVLYWVDSGKLTPTQRGGRGPGQEHRFAGSDVAAFLRRRARRADGGEA